MHHVKYFSTKGIKLPKSYAEKIFLLISNSHTLSLSAPWESDMVFKIWSKIINT